MTRAIRISACLLLLALAMWAIFALAGRVGHSAGAATGGEAVNAVIDNLKATGERILELPLSMLLAAALGLAVAAQICMGLVSRGRAMPRAARLLGVSVALTALLGLAVLADRRIGRLQDEILVLRGKRDGAVLADSRPGSVAAALTSAPSAPATTSAPQTQAPRPRLVDIAAARASLDARFPGIRLRTLLAQGWAEVVEARLDDPRIVAYLTVIDLEEPALEVQVQGNFEHKTLTTDFAGETGCSIAINGEAGISPAPRSGLGTWRGNLVSLGKVLLREDGQTQRPFLVFDRRNRARFVSAVAKPRELPQDAFHAIWGRWDALCDGGGFSTETANRQPRTAMGIGRDGTRLYLLVVDGRLPRHSIGFTKAEVGWFLHAVGASDGMLCDEGGSSCLFVNDLGGIINVPSDFQGQERPTYTHFGVGLREGAIPARR